MAKKAASKKSPAESKTSETKTSAASAGKVTKKATKKAASKKAAAKKTVAKKLMKKVVVSNRIPSLSQPVVSAAATPADATKLKKLPVAFLRKQQQKLLDLRDNLVNQMNGVARETLRGEGSDSAFGMHQADAGSDSYDRDFALNLLSQEQDALAEIDEALKRIENGSYGFCEESKEMIPQLRLEAMPFARLTVACQEKADLQQSRGLHRQPVTSLFGLDDKEKISSDSDDD